ncbi:MAG: 2-hydroxyacyl-CoA dehydratase family protein [Desulfatiglans sp.]|nr:2-hydroxyacyl-CoA dehydratase family protein [Thermodesulfobacteriota bacterium]MEE4351855.1 2-hydroxyacyl-CoA dehydratase family protein [Desulfatiglans sp.]
MDWNECKKMLALLHYTDEEMEQQKSRIQRAFDRAKITDVDIQAAQRNIVHDFDMEPARMAMGTWMKRFVDLMLCREEYKKVVYHVHPGIPRLNLAMTQAYPDLYSEFCETVLMYVFGMLDKIQGVIEAAEEYGLEQTQAQCAINQVTYGALVTDLVPTPDLVVAGRYQCDQSVKLCELISMVKKVPFVTFDTVRDEPWGFFPEVTERAVEYFGGEYGEALEESCRILEIEPLSDETWKKARKDYVLPWILLNDAHDIYIKADPRPARLSNHTPFQFGTLETSGRYYKPFMDSLQAYIKELRQRVKDGYGALPKGAPKIGMMCGTSFSMHNDADMYEEAGLNVVIPIGAVWVAPYERGEKKTEGHLNRIAWSYIQKGYVRVTYDHAYRFKTMAEHAKLDGVIYAAMFSCRVLQAGYFVKKVVEEAGYPAMVLETDPVDPRTHTADSLRTRVEAFAELLRARKENKEAA